MKGTIATTFLALLVHTLAAPHPHHGYNSFLEHLGEKYKALGAGSREIERTELEVLKSDFLIGESQRIFKSCTERFRRRAVLEFLNCDRYDSGVVSAWRKGDRSSPTKHDEVRRNLCKLWRRNDDELDGSAESQDVDEDDNAIRRKKLAESLVHEENSSGSPGSSSSGSSRSSSSASSCDSSSSGSLDSASSGSSDSSGSTSSCDSSGDSSESDFVAASSIKRPPSELRRAAYAECKRLLRKVWEQRRFPCFDEADKLGKSARKAVKKAVKRARKERKKAVKQAKKEEKRARKEEKKMRKKLAKSLKHADGAAGYSLEFDPGTLTNGSKRVASQATRGFANWNWWRRYDLESWKYKESEPSGERDVGAEDDSVALEMSNEPNERADESERNYSPGVSNPGAEKPADESEGNYSPGVSNPDAGNPADETDPSANGDPGQSIGSGKVERTESSKKLDPQAAQSTGETSSVNKGTSRRPGEREGHGGGKLGVSSDGVEDPAPNKPSVHNQSPGNGSPATENSGSSVGVVSSSGSQGQGQSGASSSADGSYSNKGSSEKSVQSTGTSEGNASSDSSNSRPASKPEDASDLDRTSRGSTPVPGDAQESTTIDWYLSEQSALTEGDHAPENSESATDTPSVTESGWDLWAEDEESVTVVERLEDPASANAASNDTDRGEANWEDNEAQSDSSTLPTDRETGQDEESVTENALPAEDPLVESSRGDESVIESASVGDSVSTNRSIGGAANSVGHLGVEGSRPDNSDSPKESESRPDDESVAETVSVGNSGSVNPASNNSVNSQGSWQVEEGKSGNSSLPAEGESKQVVQGEVSVTGNASSANSDPVNPSSNVSARPEGGWDDRANGTKKTNVSAGNDLTGHEQSAPGEVGTSGNAGLGETGSVNNASLPADQGIDKDMKSSSVVADGKNVTLDPIAEVTSQKSVGSEGSPRNDTSTSTSMSTSTSVSGSTSTSTSTSTTAATPASTSTSTSVSTSTSISTPTTTSTSTSTPTPTPTPTSTSTSASTEETTTAADDSGLSSILDPKFLTNLLNELRKLLGISTTANAEPDNAQGSSGAANTADKGLKETVEVPLSPIPTAIPARSADVAIEDVNKNVDGVVNV